MRTKFIISFLLSSSTLFLASQAYAGGEKVVGNEDLPAHPSVRQAQVKPNLSASEVLPPVQKPAASPYLGEAAPAALVSASASAAAAAPASVQRPEAWHNEWEQAVLLYVHNTNQLQFYQGRVATRGSLQTLKRMKSVLLELEGPISSLSMSQLEELTHLKRNSPFKGKITKKEDYIKVVNYYLEVLQCGLSDDEEAAQFEESRVKWHQKQLADAHREFENANKAADGAKPLSVQVIENWDGISKHLHLYFAFYDQARESTEGLLASALEHFKKFVPQQLVASQPNEANANRGMERSQDLQPGASAAAPDIPQPAPMSLAASLTPSQALSMQGSLGSLPSEGSAHSLYASASSEVLKPASSGRSSDSMPIGSRASGARPEASPVASAELASQQPRPAAGSRATEVNPVASAAAAAAAPPPPQQQAPQASASPSPAMPPVMADVASVASVDEEDEEAEGVWAGVDPADAPGYSYPKTQTQIYADSAQRAVIKCVRFATEAVNAVVQVVS